MFLNISFQTSISKFSSPCFAAVLTNTSYAVMMNKLFPNQAKITSALSVEGSFDYFIQQAVEKALMNVSEPLLESVVDRIIARKMTENKDEPLTIDQAAKLIHKKKQTIYSYCSSGKIPFHKNGNHNVFFRSELVEWLKAN